MVFVTGAVIDAVVGRGRARQPGVDGEEVLARRTVARQDALGGAASVVGRINLHGRSRSESRKALAREGAEKTSSFRSEPR